MPKGDKLQPKQELFCKEYLIDFCGKQAAIRAGYSKKTANEQASKMLTNANIQTQIAKLSQKRNDKLDLSAEKIGREYKRIGFFDVRKLYDENGNLTPIHLLDDETAAAVCSVDYDEIYSNKENIGKTTKIKTNSKISALEALSKHIGFFKEDNEQQNKLLLKNNINSLFPDEDEINGASNK